MIGQLLDHYSVEAQLGAGGMGVVYKAFDVRLERPVAIKFLTYPSAGAVREILSEARVASALNHPHICTIHEVCEAAGQAFIVMEYVEGQTLREVIPLDGLAVESMVAYAIQIADGLAHAHDHGVIHRDLKSANIVITPDGRTKILDFGLALRFTPSQFDEISKLTTREDTNSHTTAGTPAYMAPEVLRGLQPDARSDVWALGVVLYEMLTGRLPFSGRNNAELCTEILREPPWPLRTSIDTGLRGVVLRCLMKEPRQRYQRASEVRAALETIHRQLEGAAPPSERAPSVPVRSNWRPTRKMKLTTGAALAATVLFSLAIPQTRRMILPSSWLQRAGGSAERRSIAVFPFRSIGGDAEASLLAGGLSETLAARLFQSTALPIASGAAVERAAARGSIDTAARELGVDVLVTGTVQQMGGTLRVIVNLDDVKNGRRLWAQEISGSRSNLMSMEDRLLAGLLDALHIAPSEPMAAASPTSNTEAYNLYLKGMNALREKPDPDGAKAAIQFYEEAVRQDAGFALAYAAMSEAMLQIYREKKDRQLGDRAQYMAERARQLDPARPETHLAVGTVYNAIGGKGLEATAALKRALALSPNSDKAHRELGRALAATGHGQEAMQSVQKAVELNAFDPAHYNVLGSIANELGRYSEAADAFRKVIEFEPDNVRGYSNLGAMHLKMGQFDEAAHAFQNALKIKENASVYTNLGITYANMGRFAEAVRMQQKAVDLEPNEARLLNLADAYRLLGERGKADPIYDKAIAVALQKLKAKQDAGTIAALALSSAKRGRFPQAMQYIGMARRIKPNDPDFISYEATIQVLADHIPQALASLRDAFRAGYSPAFARQDPDFRVLRGDPSFEAVMKEFSGGPR